MTCKRFIIDDPERMLFKVSRSVFTRPELLEKEKETIFNQCWIYVGHESEVTKKKATSSREMSRADRSFLIGTAAAGYMRSLILAPIAVRSYAGKEKATAKRSAAFIMRGRSATMGIP